MPFRSRHEICPWKSRRCAELKEFDVAFAIKEYLQNQVDQVLKEREIRGWSGWIREDLQHDPVDVRSRRKTALLVEYPQIFAGTGAKLLAQPGWLPVYILRADIPLAKPKSTVYKTPLRLCTILWHHESSMTGVSVFNNHLDNAASFETFVMDGRSTSSLNKFAVGEKGKGFILATQYLHENIEESSPRPNDENTSAKLKLGVSFRVGHSLGELSWQRKQGRPVDILQVKEEDLTIRTTDGLWDHYLYKKYYGRRRIGLKDRAELQTALNNVAKRRSALGLSPVGRVLTDTSKQRSLVGADDVSITVLGLSGHLSATEVFAGIYSVIPFETSWRCPGSDIEFYLPKKGELPKFYLRDQMIRSGPPIRLLGINYHGDLSISADRVMIQFHGKEFDRYTRKLDSAVRKTFASASDECSRRLTYLIAQDIMADTSESGAAIGHVLKPERIEDGREYKRAFERVWLGDIPATDTHQPVFPYTDAEDVPLIRDFGMRHVFVQHHVLRLLQESGAWPKLRIQAEIMLRQSSVQTEEIPGFHNLRLALTSIFTPWLETDQIKMHTLVAHRSSPKAMYEGEANGFIIGTPRDCAKHPDSGLKCLCWVAPCLFKAVTTYEEATGNCYAEQMFESYGRFVYPDVKRFADPHMTVVHDARDVTDETANAKVSHSDSTTQFLTNDDHQPIDVDDNTLDIAVSQLFETTVPNEAPATTMTPPNNDAPARPAARKDAASPARAQTDATRSATTHRIAPASKTPPAFPVPSLDAEINLISKIKSQLTQVNMHATEMLELRQRSVSAEKKDLAAADATAKELRRKYDLKCEELRHAELRAVNLTKERDEAHGKLEKLHATLDEVFGPAREGLKRRRVD
ncbi:MAG: hypothetical protein M1825_005650 [Sarcosagium campestre]|nr:MAG: hypothetical protein M1825_005650 [Sarcosagium campestre]